MKFLHTSDWHLGAELFAHSRLDEQASFLKWLLELAQTEAPDCCLVSGDLFDVTNPPVAAQKLLTEFLVELHRRLPHTQLIVTAGNHDSAHRLDVLRPLGLALEKLSIIGTVPREHPEELLVPVLNAAGTPCAVVLALPFLRPGDLEFSLQENETPALAYGRSVASLLARLREQARLQFPGLPLLGMAHLSLSHSHSAGSEHALIGGIDGVALSPLLEGLDYLALGHIHRPQKMAGGRACYSGSPLAMDFDERAYPHQVLIGELLPEPEGGTSLDLRSVLVPAIVPFLALPAQPGSWEELEQAVLSLPWADYTPLPRGLQPFVQLRLKKTPEFGLLRQKVEELLEHRPLRLAGPLRMEEERVAQESNGGAAEEGPDTGFELDSPDMPLHIFTEAFRSRHGLDCPAELLEEFQDIVQELRRGGPEA